MADIFTLRTLRREDWADVAEMIHVSLNAWYQASGKPAKLTGDPALSELFPRVYEALDPGCCIVAENTRTGRVIGSCFYHPRSTHYSIGIVNVHPAYFGYGIARRMLQQVIEKADAEGLPLRLVSSAQNLDSFSLYTRAGFVPRMIYQDLLYTVPEEGIPGIDPAVRPAGEEDIPAMVALEKEISGLEREKDYRYFLKNEEGIWYVSVLPSPEGSGLDGFLVSIVSPSSRMLGPGVARNEDTASRLIRAHLDRHRGQTLLYLVPGDSPALVADMYALGARNCELHLAQVRGEWSPPKGVVLHTFMPETG